jgi:hypothetical protein
VELVETPWPRSVLGMELAGAVRALVSQLEARATVGRLDVVS